MMGEKGRVLVYFKPPSGGSWHLYCEEREEEEERRERPPFLSSSSQQNK